MPNTPGNDERNTTADEGMNGSKAAGSNNGQTDGASAPGRRSNRGFASMDRSKQKEIASKGGRAAHAKGTAHEFDSGEARDAGRKGGVAVSRNREHMAAIGRRGGEARGHARGAKGLEDGMQNARSTTHGEAVNASTGSDRQVAIDNQRDGVAGRGSAPAGTERRPMGTDASRDQNAEKR